MPEQSLGSRPCQDVRTEAELAGVALALGARSVGKLSREETELAKSAVSISSTHADALGVEILRGEDPLGTCFCQLRSPEVTVDIARDRAQSLGISAEQIQQALFSAYGNRLTSTIFTRDVGKVFRFAERAQAGIIHVNRPGVGGYSHAPFGGIKESGYGGREVGDEVMSFYTETKVVYVNYK